MAAARKTTSTGLVVTDRRSLRDGSLHDALIIGNPSDRGATGLAIQDAAQLAEPFIDIASNSLKDDAVFVPQGDRVAVRRIPEAVTTKLGIHLPDTGKTPPAFGVVVGVGQGRYNLVGQLIPLRVEVGAVVMFGKYAGTEIPLFGAGSKERTCLLLREEEVMGVVMSAEVAKKIAADSDPQITPTR